MRDRYLQSHGLESEFALNVCVSVCESELREKVTYVLLTCVLCDVHICLRASKRERARTSLPSLFLDSATNVVRNGFSADFVSAMWEKVFVLRVWDWKTRNTAVIMRFACNFTRIRDRSETKYMQIRRRERKKPRENGEEKYDINGFVMLL